MMKNTTNNDITYVLFGKEATLIYKVSPRMLLATKDVQFCVGAFSSVKVFVKESKLWDGFIEISKQDYNLLKAHSCGPRSSQKKRTFLDILFRS